MSYFKNKHRFYLQLYNRNVLPELEAATGAASARAPSLLASTVGTAASVVAVTASSVALIEAASAVSSIALKFVKLKFNITHTKIIY